MWEAKNFDVVGFFYNHGYDSVCVCSEWATALIQNKITGFVHPKPTAKCSNTCIVIPVKIPHAASLPFFIIKWLFLTNFVKYSITDDQLL